MVIVDDPLELVRSRLHNVKGRGERFSAQCAGHEDGHNSLSVSRGQNGAVILKCHAGCSTERVVEAMGLKMSDLYPKEAPPVKPHVAAIYQYRDEAGTVLYEALRYEPKDFRQRVPLQGGGYEWQLNGTRRVLYRFPQLLATKEGDLVMVVEGEKDADTLAGLGFTATCNVGGAGKWRDEYGVYLMDRHVVVFADNDEKGRKHAVDVALSCKGMAKSIRVILPPGVAEHGDISDWLATGKGREDVLQLARTAPRFDFDSAEQFIHPPRKHKTLADYLKEPPDNTPWLVDELWKPGQVCLLSARSGVGKSTLARTAASQITLGGRFLRRECMRGTVVYCALEEDPRDVMDDFERMGADTDLIVPKFFDEMPATGKEVEWLREIMRDVNPVAVVIDTIVGFAHIKNANDYAEVTAKLGAVRDAFRATGVCGVWLHHMTKPSKLERESGEIDMDDTDIMGSEAFRGVIDLSMIMKMDYKTGRRHVATGKIRRATPIEPSTLQMDPESRVITIEGKINDVKMNRARSAIMDFLRRESRATRAMIVTESGCDTGTVPAALRSLLDDGYIVREGQGIARDPYWYSLHL